MAARYYSTWPGGPGCSKEYPLISGIRADKTILLKQHESSHHNAEEVFLSAPSRRELRVGKCNIPSNERGEDNRWEYFKHRLHIWKLKRCYLCQKFDHMRARCSDKKRSRVCSRWHLMGCVKNMTSETGCMHQLLGEWETLCLESEVRNHTHRDYERSFKERRNFMRQHFIYASLFRTLILVEPSNSFMWTEVDILTSVESLMQGLEKDMMDSIEKQRFQPENFTSCIMWKKLADHLFARKARLGMPWTTGQKIAIGKRSLSAAELGTGDNNNSIKKHITCDQKPSLKKKCRATDSVR